MLVGSGMELAYRGAYFNVPLRIDGETFQIDTFLLSIGDDIDVIVGTPWLADVGNTLEDFASLEMQFQWGNHIVTFTNILDCRAFLQSLALTAPPLAIPAQPSATTVPVPVT
jgi:hypothetical protein